MEATVHEEAMDEANASASSSSESEDDRDGADRSNLEALEAALAENPSNYEAHVQYIQCLRKLGEIEKLRESRKSMSKLFPLSPVMWQEWARDELSLNKGSEAFSEVEEIYEKGVHEYLSVPLWCDYFNFVQEHDQLVAQCVPDGISKMRNLFERAIIAAGLHIAEGNKIWESYREFEQAIYLTLDGSNGEEKTRQIQRIRSLFHRQLSVPLADMKSTLLTYKGWEVEQGNILDTVTDDLSTLPANLASSYQKALEMYNVRGPYEAEISKQDVYDVERLQAYKSYIKFEERSGDPARVQVLYERAVTEFSISSDLWMEYTSYLDKNLKISGVLKDVYSRATRNCTWVGELWTRYLLSLERFRASENELSTVFEQSLLSALPTTNEYFDLFLTRIDGLRRRISSTTANNEGLEFGLIRETFQRAADYLTPDMIKIEDLLHLHAYWARLEVQLGKDLVAGRGVWESLIKRSGSLLEVWHAYITMETEMGHINEARSIYKRCYSKRFAGTGSEDICYSWLRFEREFGSLDDFDLAMRKVMPRLEELRLFRTQQESQNRDPLTAKQDDSVKGPLKRKLFKTSSDKQSSAKRKKESITKSHEVFGVDVGNKLTVAHDAETSEKFNVSSSPTATEKRHETVVKDGISKAFNEKNYTDQCTAFVSNISLEANEEHLREFFNGTAGGVTAIRLLKDKFTKRSRGLAYVDFSSEEHLSSAIAKNKQRLLGKKISVARSDPKQSHKQDPATGRGRKTISGSKHSGREDTESSSGSQLETSHRRGGHVQLVGRNTFAMPRNVARPLGWSSKDSSKEEIEEKLDSNEEFRKMLLKN